MPSNILILANNISTTLGFVIVISVVAIVIFIAYYFSRKQRVLRALSKFKYRKITQFQTNELTKVIGKTLHVHEPFVAPFSKRKCVAFHFVIQQKRSNGKSSYWKTLVEQSDIQDFFVEDQGEVVMIKPTKVPKNYINYMVTDRSVSSGVFNAPSPKFLELLKHYGVNSKNLLGFNKNLRYTESIIEVGETVTVGGIAKWKKLSEPLSGYSYSQIATLESSDEQKIVITDHPSAQFSQRKL
ncbi:hypothetical protein [Winogradskyella sp. 3972H.M.0a.05]|uniref:hypothetical protein n=1 Tax=Winogradskyella sp. 3972H.M.0a.05 TaxID=2950277 RepID=UPI00339513CD